MTEENSDTEAEGVAEPAAEQGGIKADVGETIVASEKLKAVFRMGARQYCAGVGDMVSIPDYPNAWKDKENVIPFKREICADVLMVTGDRTIIGTPSIPGAQVTLELTEFNRGKKVINFKRRRRKHSSKRTKGYQWLVFDFIVKSLELPKSETEASAAAGT